MTGSPCREAEEGRWPVGRVGTSLCSGVPAGTGSLEAAPDQAPSAVLPRGETRSLAAVIFSILRSILFAMYTQRAWPSCAFLKEPLAKPGAPSRGW